MLQVKLPLEEGNLKVCDSPLVLINERNGRRKNLFAQLILDETAKLCCAELRAKCVEN